VPGVDLRALLVTGSVVSDSVRAVGLPLLFIFIALESAGIPVPGETALSPPRRGCRGSPTACSPPSERFSTATAGKTVFFARFIAILRFTAAWLAEFSKMPWGRFLFWNAAAGICWAVGLGLLAYLLGQAAADAIDKYGYAAAGAILVILVGGYFVVRYWKKRVGLEGDRA
jgi:membrane protein DedA with SNARE-associated domain